MRCACDLPQSDGAAQRSRTSWRPVKRARVSDRRPSMAADDHVPARLRVLSANLWNGRAHPDGFAALVERMRADVVAVQEMGPAQAAALRPRAAARRPRSRRRLHRHGHRQPRAGAGAPPDAAAPRRAGGGDRVAVTRRRQGHRRGAQHPRRGAAHDADLDDRRPPPRPVARTRAAHQGEPASRAAGRRRFQLDAALAVLPAHGRPPARRGGDPRPPPRRARRPHLGAVAWVSPPLRIDHAFVQHLEIFDFEVVEVPDGDHSAVVVEIGIKEEMKDKGTKDEG